MEEKKLEVEMSQNESQEITLDPKKVLISITDTSGNIEYCNDEFAEVTGFDTMELVGYKHNLLRHADMPSTLYKYIWQRLEKEEELSAIIKNKDKNGDFYWFMVDFLIRRDDEGKIIGYRANRKPIRKNAIDLIIPFYKKLTYLERLSGEDFAMDFFEKHFKIRKISYDDFINNLIGRLPRIEIINKEKKSKLTSVKNMFRKK